MFGGTIRVPKNGAQEPHFSSIFGKHQLNNMHYSVIITILCLYLSSCTLFDYSYEKQIGESYFIRCIESRDRMDIGFGSKEISEQLVGNTVFEVHWDSTFITAKRHPAGLGEEKRSVTEYFIVKKVKFGKENASENMYGPLTSDEYIQMKSDLGINEGKMDSVVFDDLK